MEVKAYFCLSTCIWKLNFHLEYGRTMGNKAKLNSPSTNICLTRAFFARKVHRCTRVGDVF